MNINSDEIITFKHKRTFIQFGGARPANPVQYFGQDGQYMVIDGVGVPELGGVTPIYVPDPNRQGQYRMVGRRLTPPDLAKATLKMLEKHGSIPRQLQKMGCQFNLYEPTGACDDLSDFLGGWTDYVLIYSGAIVTDKSLGTRSTWDTDDNVEDSLALVLAAVYPIGALGFGEQAAAQVDREVVDIVYGSRIQCGDCNVPDDGTQRIYSVTKSSGAGSPGIPAEVQYSLDGGSSWTESSITGIGATADPVAIDIVGDRLIVVVASENAYYYADLDINGNPGTWTKVTTGFVATKLPRDLYVASPREIWFCADGGYVYKSTNITSGVTVANAASATTNDLKRIHGKDETIVAVGAASTVIKSINRGQTFSTTTTNPSLVAVDLQAVAVLDRLRYWVGSAVGRVHYTRDGGETWSDQAFSGAGAGQVRDIVFPTDEVGFFAHDTSTPTARVFTTWNGGADWTMAAPRILNMPVYDRANRIATPHVDPSMDVNYVAIAGLGGNGTDGIILVGIASRI